VGRLLYRIGELAARRRWPVLAVWAAVAVALALLVGRYGSNTSDDLRLPGADSQAASDLLASRFPPQQNGSSPIVFHVPTGKVTDAATKQAIEASRSAILQLPHVQPARRAVLAQARDDGLSLGVGRAKIRAPAEVLGLRVAHGRVVGAVMTHAVEASSGSPRVKPCRFGSGARPARAARRAR